MPSFDWMDQSSFRDEITNRVSQVAATEGMKQYQTAIVENLMELLKDRGGERRIEEARKVDEQQRTKSDALISVNTLIEEASSYARAEKRTTVTKSDFERAYQAKFCMVWPFC